MLHTLFTLVGPSGSGKTTLITGAVERIPGLHIIRTTTSRTRRGAEDDLHYQFANKQLIEAMNKQGKLLQVEEYAGNYYCTVKKYVQDMLENNDCINALTEHGIEQFLAAAIPLKVIAIVPLGAPQASHERQAADLSRARKLIEHDFSIRNDFTKPGGKERSIDQLVAYIEGHRTRSGKQSHPLLTMPPPPRTPIK